MSQIYYPGNITALPSLNINTGTVATNSNAIAATGDAVCYVGTIILENPNASAKTISAAGGGSITWRTGTVTNANAGTTFDVGIQDVSTATAPSQGDGVYDVKATYSGAGALASNTAYTTTMSSGSKSITNGQMICVSFTMSARGGTDSVVIANSYGDYLGNAQLLPAVTKGTTGSFVRTSNALPNCYIKFDDGTIGWFYGAYYTNVGTTSFLFNSGTGTADEYGNLIQVPYTFEASGVSVVVYSASSSADYEVILYTDPLGTPTAVRTLTVDATQIAVTSSLSPANIAFTTPYKLKANTPYALTVRPTTANNLQVSYIDPANAAAAKTVGVGNQFYAVRRLDNTGAFSDYNGGVAKTRIMVMRLLGSSMEQGVNNAQHHIGNL